MSNIRFFAEEIHFMLPAPDTTASWIRTVIQQEGYVLAHLNIIFCSDHYLLTQNVQYLQHDTLTDVLTFDYTDQAGIIEGDIYISIDRVRANAQTWQQSFTKELQTVIVHGVLHLLGYDDRTPEAKALMRQKETEYVAKGQSTTTAADDSAYKAARISQAVDKRNGEDIHPSRGLCNPD